MQKIIILQDFLLILLFKELIDALFLLLITLVVLMQSKETVIEITMYNYNVLIHGRNFHDQQINDQIKKYDEIRKIATGVM